MSPTGSFESVGRRRSVSPMSSLPQGKLQRGDIVVFSISPGSIAAQYGSLPNLTRRLQALSLGRYLGIITTSAVQPNSHTDGSANEEVEKLDIAFVGRTPPSSNTEENQEVLPLLPNRSMAFAAIPMQQQRGPTEPAAPRGLTRPPLRVTGDQNSLPLSPSFVHTTVITKTHLAELHPGAPSHSLKLADGEWSRLRFAREEDSNLISAAHRQLSRGQKLASPRATSPHDHESSAPTRTAKLPIVVRFGVEAWTDMTNTGPISEPAAFWNELEGIQSIIEECYAEEKAAHIKGTPATDKQPAKTSTLSFVTNNAFQLGLVAASVGVLAMILIRRTGLQK